MWPFQKIVQPSVPLSFTDTHRNRLHFIAGCMGSTGDVLPLVTVAACLRQRGHQVTLVAPPMCEMTAERYRLSFVPVSTPDSYRRSMEDFFLCCTRYAPLFLIRHAIEWNRVFYQTARSLATPNMVILTVHLGFIWADYIMHAQFGTATLRVQFDPPAPAGLPAGMPLLPSGRVQASLLARFDREWAHSVNGDGVRQRHHLWQRMWRAASSIPRLGLYPDWLATTKSSTRIRTLGFVKPLNLDREVYQLPFDITPAERLIVFVAGTMGCTASWSQEFYSVSAEICNRLGCKGILLGLNSPKDIARLGRRIVWCEFAPLDQILPHASVLVHHGGAGTAAAAIASGVPQLVVPRFGQQPGTAEHLRRLGVAIVLHPQAYTVQRSTASIRALLEDDIYRSRSISLALRPNSFDSTARICDHLEARFGAVLEPPDRRDRNRCGWKSGTVS